MNSKITRFITIVIFAMLFLVMAQPSSSVGSTLEVVEPVENQTLDTSNVSITVRFNFTADADRQTFRAWLNGKRVDSLFNLTESDAARGLLSACDGVRVSVHGPRWNVFRAEVNGQNGRKYRQIVRFSVDGSGNNAPVAQPAPGGHVFAGETVELDGSNSSDADDDPIKYRWSLVSRPRGSRARLSNLSSVNPNFVPDMPGVYEARLVVRDCKTKSEPKTVTVSVEELTILVDGTVQDPIFEALSRYATVTEYDGSQRPGNYGLVVLDGNNLTPEDIQSSPLVKQALEDGTWVLAFHVSGEQKTAGLMAHLNIVSANNETGSEASNAYLFRRYIGSDGVPVTRTIELPPLSQPDSGGEPGTKDYQAYAGTILEDVRTTPLRTSEPPVPDGLVVSRWYYTVSLPWTKNYSLRHPSTEGRVQNASHTVNYTFTLYLENGTIPPRQVLLLEVDGQANPNTPGSTFIANEHLEHAWVQSGFTVEVRPQDTFWRWVANEPSSVNKLTSYTTNVGFSLSISAIGPTATWSYSKSTSYSIPDWGVSCKSSDYYMYWEWLSQNPAYDNLWDWYTFWEFPRVNDIAVGQAQYHAAVVWRTDQLVDRIAAFSVKGKQATFDIACTLNLALTCGSRETREAYYTYDRTYMIDLGVVMPIDIAAITFSQDPAPVGPSGGRIKGSVVLERPARMDTTILGIKSNDLHATPVNDRVVVKKGNRTASFEIMVNAGQVQTGSTVWPSISAFYGKQYNQQFAIKAVDNLWFPATSPSFDPFLLNWGSLTQPGNWADGYMVRYAVSFVDSNGRESERGPWTDWMEGAYYLGHAIAMPNLINIPSDASNRAVARRVYRQFFANYQTGDPSAGVSLIATLNNNTTTTYLDNNP